MSRPTEQDPRFEVSERSPYHKKRAGLEQPVGSRVPRAMTLIMLSMVLLVALVALR